YVKKCEAINGDHVRMLSLEEFTDRLVPYFQTAGLLSEPVTATEREQLAAAAPLVHERSNLLTEAVSMLRFLFVAEDDFTVDETDRAKQLDEQGLGVVKAARAALAELDEWSTAAIEAALRDALVDGL